MLKNLITLLVPLVLTVASFGAAWWYVTIYNAPAQAAAATSASQSVSAPLGATTAETEKPQELSIAEEKPEELGAAEKPQELGGAEPAVESTEPTPASDAPPQEMGSLGESTSASATGKIPEHFYAWFWGLPRSPALLLAIYYWRMDGEQLEILKELVVSVVPLGVLTVVVLAVILFGITTATESAAIGALGAMYLAVMMKYPSVVWWSSLVGLIAGVALGWPRGGFVPLLVSGSLSGVFLGTARASAMGPTEVARAAAEPQGVGIPDGEDNGNGVLALRRLGTLLQRLCAPRWPGVDRALGARHGLIAGRLLDRSAVDYFSARLAA